MWPNGVSSATRCDLNVAHNRSGPRAQITDSVNAIGMDIAQSRLAAAIARGGEITAYALALDCGLRLIPMPNGPTWIQDGALYWDASTTLMDQTIAICVAL